MRPIRPLVSLIPTAIMLTALVATAPMVAAATIPAQTGAGRPGVSGNARADWYPQFLFHGQNRVNPNETILGANNVSGLTSFWTFPTPPVSAFAAPVVDRGLLFEGEYAGAVQALDATTGQVVWSYQAAAPVVVASAVADGAVFAGDKNGTLYALDEQTGTLLWTGPVSGDQFFDPDNITVVGGTVYAATLTLSASSGTLSAWSASGCGALTCSPLWTANIGAVEAGPAVSDTRVFVAAADGGLYAFSTTGCPTPPCAPLWKGLFSAGGGGNVYGSLVISDGIVYVSNGSGRVVDAFAASGCPTRHCLPSWAYDAKQTGPAALAVARNQLWAAAVGGLEEFPARCPVGSVCEPIWTDTAAPGAHLLVANGVVYGDSGTTVFADDASTGQRLWQETITASCASGPAVADGVVYFAATFANEILAYHLPESR